ncbi:hypothetical protein AVEN_173077-1 [Araneus ventricosus]|uniref:Uncharacterized protein n=1 Tax=Araneus ventricosus TaxID=182803 RepID=A0A4Y2HE78_ARAVE|nr:hypothetical protein AVEN_173077-1 [Araneus ventricosus]
MPKRLLQHLKVTFHLIILLPPLLLLNFLSNAHSLLVLNSPSLNPSKLSKTCISTPEPNINTKYPAFHSPLRSPAPDWPTSIKTSDYI